MDLELKVYLDGMRQGLMTHAEQLNQETRQDLTQQIAESRQHAERLNRETREHAEQLNQESRQHAEQLNQGTRILAKQLNQETRILMEALHDDVRGVADGVLQLNARLDRLEQSMTEQFQQHDKRLMRLEASRPRR